MAEEQVQGSPGSGPMAAEALQGTVTEGTQVDQESSLDLFPPLVVEPLQFEDEEGVLKKILGWYNQDMASTLRADFLARSKEYHKAYLGYMPPTSFPWEDCSNVDLGIIEMAVDNIKARFKMSAIGGKPAFVATPLSLGAELIQRDVQELMSSALDQQVDIEKVVDSIAQDTVELGNCVVKRRWAREPKNVRVFNQEQIPIKFKAPFMNLFNRTLVRFKLEVQKVVEEMCKVEIVSLDNILVPENAPEDPQKMHHFMHLFSIEESNLETFFNQDKTYDKASLPELKEFLSKEGKPKDNPSTSEKVTEGSVEPTLKCAEVYCKLKHKGEEDPEEVIITVALEAKKILRKVRLIDIYFDGLRPFRWFRYKSTGSVYGRGVAEMLYPYRTALNTTFNMSVNCMMLQIMPWGFYRYGSSFKPEDHKLSPGVWIPLDDINDARPAQFPPTARLADGAIALLIQLVERQSGISAPHMGQQTSGRKTAFEVRAVISEGNIKHEERIDAFKDVFSDLLKDIFNLYKFNLPDNQVFRKLFDERGQQLKQPVFFKPANRYILSKYDFDFVVLGTLTTGNKAIERDDAITLSNWLMGLPIVAENPDAQYELVKDVVQSFGKRDMERYLPPKELTEALKRMKMKELAEIASGQREPMGGAGRPQGGGA